jgi:hypothetical protein
MSKFEKLKKLVSRVNAAPGKKEHYLFDPKNRKIQQDYEQRKFERMLEGEDQKDPEEYYPQNLVEPVEDFEELFKKNKK